MTYVRFILVGEIKSPSNGMKSYQAVTIVEDV